MKRAKGGIVTIALFAVAATLLVFSVVGSSQAALTYFSETYGAQVQMHDIGVTLVENDLDEAQRVSWRDYNEKSDSENELNNWEANTGELVQEILKQPEGRPESGKEELRLGHKYKEELSVRNTGTIDEYVRVTIYRYWEKDGEKDPTLDSSLIDLHLTLENGWHRSPSTPDTEERTVLYYDSVLPVGATTPIFADTLEILDEGIEAEVTWHPETDENGNTVIVTEYDYDGAKFVLKVDVDAVQTHNADKAMMSAWGIAD